MSDSEDSTITYTKAPPSPDYVLGPEEPEQAPPLPEFVPKPDHEEDPTDYPADEGDDDDDDDGSSDDEEDDDDVEEDEDEHDKEEEEHPAPADSILPSPVHRVTARMSIREQPPTPVWSKAEIDRLPAIPSPSPLPLSLWSLPLPQIPLPPLPVSPPLPIVAPRSETPPSGTPPLILIPLPTSSPYLMLPSMSHRADVPEVTLPPRKRLCIALGMRFQVGKSSSAPTARLTGGFRADYGFVATLDDEIRRVM
nr:hypothetical protein [Tanacetum cinerariifolium]